MGGALVISLDFELLWGVRDSRTVANYGANLHGSREVVPQLLELFVEHGIHATWATVGFLFCEGREEIQELLPELRPQYAHTALDPYGDVARLGPDERRDPLHFAPSLVRRIAETCGQEVATHTFSHYYCLEGGQTAAAFEADLRAATEAARRRGVTLRSIVFPRNEVNEAYLPVCRAAGLSAYRGTPRAWIHRARSASEETRLRRAARLVDAYVPLTQHAGEPPILGPYSLVNVAATRFLRPLSGMTGRLDPLAIRRIVGEMEDAARTGAVYHLWWHPHNFGVRREEHLSRLKRILCRFVELRESKGMRSATMADVARGTGA